MNKIKKSIKIDAPLEQVFAYLADANNLPEIWPSLIEVSNVVDSNGQRSFDYLYKMAGLPFQGHSETIEFEPNERIMTQSKKGIRNVLVYSFSREDDKTKVTMQVEYDIPNRLLSALAEPIVRRINEREARALLNNLKDRMELSLGNPLSPKTQSTPPTRPLRH